MIVEGNNMPAFFASHSQELLAYIACIAIKDHESRVVGKGTATFALHEEKRLILTAGHVVTALEEVDASLRVLLLPALTQFGDFPIGVPSAPTETAFPLNVLWRDGGLDVAVLDGSFVPETRVRWFPPGAFCRNLREGASNLA